MVYFHSPISVIPLRQNLRIIKCYQYTEIFTRKGASPDTMYKVFCFNNKVTKIIHDKCVPVVTACCVLRLRMDEKPPL